jgi:Skp family chaperone for outer membrane proteins
MAIPAMRPVFHTLVSFTICAAALLSPPAECQSQAVPIKIALIAFEQATFATHEGQQMVKDIQAQFAPKKTEIDGLSAEIDTLRKQLQAGNWPAAERTSRESVIDQKEKQLTHEAETAQAAYNDALQKSYQALAQKLSPLVSRYVQQNGFTVLIDVSDKASPVMWALSSTDITQAVVDAYDATSNSANGQQNQAASKMAPQAIPAKVALVSFESAVLATTEGQQAVQNIQTKYAPKKIEITEDSAELDRLKKELESGKWTEKERASVLSVISRKEKHLNDETEAASAAYNADLQEVWDPIAKKYSEQLKNYVSRGGYTILFDKPGEKLANVMWAAPGVKIETITSPGGVGTDVTSATVQAYNSSRPRIPAPAPTAPVQVARTLVPSTPEPDNPQPAVPKLNNGKYYALVIGIDKYPDPLPKLKTAVADAQAVAKVLQVRYGFEVKTLINEQATRANVLDAIYQYRLKLKAADNDNLLIYYAGHGYSDKEAGKAYWLPVDADSAWNRISADDLTSGVKVQPARHVLIISDSCYSGDLSRDVSIVPRRTDQQAYLTYLGKMLGSRSRTIMASGGDEPVADGGEDGHSVFAYALLQALEHADEDMFTAGDLFNFHLKQRVGGNSDQQPRYDIIRNSGHDEGDFVFVRRAGQSQ